jgi:hypothetical protein
MHSNVKNAHVLSDDALDQIFGGDGGAPNHSIVNTLGRSMELWGGAAVVVGSWAAVTSTGEDLTIVGLPLGIPQGAAGVALVAAGGTVAYFGNILANVPSNAALAALPQGRVTVGADITEPGWDPA